MKTTRLTPFERNVLIGFGIVGLSILFGLLSLHIAARLLTPSILGRIGSHSESDGAITVIQARSEYKQLDFPDNATAVRYSVICYGPQSGENYVRFSAPPDTCVTVGEITPRKHLASSAEVSSDELFVPLDKDSSNQGNWRGSTSNRSISTGSNPPDWFAVRQIKNGLVSSVREVGVPTIWIDTDNGVFYFHLSD